VVLDFDAQRGGGTLRWKAAASGNKPTNYRIYGSDEKGFSISDKPYKANVGASKDLPNTFPANFIAETTATEFVVLGPDVSAPSGNKTYYRVVALDEKEKRSGPSDYAAAPRPVIYSKPATTAVAGKTYEYRILATRSLGDLTSRQVDGGGKEVANFWAVENPTFELQQGPKWLRIDAKTGLLSGTPDAAGKYDVAVTAKIDHDVRKVNESALIWGNEKVISNTTERVGSNTQKFTIEVQPAER
jgi:hypothetical protein